MTLGGSPSPAVGIATRLAAALVVVTTAGVAVALLVTGPLARALSRDVDVPGSRYFVARVPVDVTVVRWVGQLGNPVVVAVVVVVSCSIVGVRSRTWAPLHAGVASWVGAVVITTVTRLAVSRPAADGPVRGFPSGHVVTAAAVFGALALVCAASALPWLVRAMMVVLAVVIPFAVAWSRLVLLAHVPSDVVGGALLGEVWAVVVAGALCARGGRDAP